MAPQSQQASLRRLAVDPQLQLPRWNSNFMLHTIAGGPPAAEPTPPQKTPKQQREKTPQPQPAEKATVQQGSHARRIVFGEHPHPRPLQMQQEYQRAHGSRPTSRSSTREMATPGKGGVTNVKAKSATTPVAPPDSAMRERTSERNPKTPMSFRRAQSGHSWRQHVDVSAPLSAASLRRLPNALDAEFWLRGAEAKNEAGDHEAAEALLRKGIKRGARPVEVLHRALEALIVGTEPTPDSYTPVRDAAAQAQADGPSTFAAQAPELCVRELSFGSSLIPKYTPAAATPVDTTANTTTPSRRARQLGSPHRVKTPGSKMYRELKALQGGLGPELRAADEALGRLELLTPVRIKSNDQAEELGSAMVLTQVRRSARKPPAQEEELDDLLTKCNYSYAPHDQFGNHHEGDMVHERRAKNESREGLLPSGCRDSDAAVHKAGEAEMQFHRYATRSASKQRRQSAKTATTPVSGANLIHMFEAHDVNVITPPPASTATTPGKTASGIRRSARLHLSAKKSEL